MSHPIDNLLKNTMESLKNLIDVNTIVGNPFKTEDGSTIIPVSKVCLGFASAGTEFSTCINDTCTSNESNDFPFGGGSGAGVSVKPVAFLIVKNDKFRIVSLDSDNAAEKVIDSIPQLLEIVKNIGDQKDDKKNSSYDKTNTDN